MLAVVELVKINVYCVVCIEYVESLQRANSYHMNYQCVQFHMDGHFNDKPSYLMSGDSCHLPKTVFPSHTYLHTQLHIKLTVNSIFRYCTAHPLKLSVEIQMCEHNSTSRLFSLLIWPH